MTEGRATELVRFFCVVPPVPWLLWGTMLVVTAIGGLVTVHDPSLGARALAPVLLLQLFSASSSFAVPARRGRYDLLLTSRGRRATVALAHWVASIAPGVACWLVLALAELAGSRGGHAALLAPGTWAAVSVISTVPWAFGVALPRFGSAIGWLVVLIGTRNGLSVDAGWQVDSSGLGGLWPAWSFLADPFAVVGLALARSELIAIAPGLVLAASAMIAACVWAACADVPLEAGQ